MIRLLKTEDGSDTLYHETLKEVYHSKHGAITESRHVFIQAGLVYQFQHFQHVALLEVGMGTGLNVLLSALAAADQKKYIRYVGMEPYPPEQGLINQLNYASLMATGSDTVWKRIHSGKWEEWTQINSYTVLHKQKQKVERASFHEGHFQLVYFDAFSPEVSSTLWDLEIFKKIYRWLSPGGILVTYSAKGNVRRNLNTAGFNTDKIPGPPGKREMLRAVKPITG